MKLNFQIIKSKCKIPGRPLNHPVAKETIWKSTIFVRHCRNLRIFVKHQQQTIKPSLPYGVQHG
jgi:hypothetical protein